jgi:predicted RND superfamily exporter protein
MLGRSYLKYSWHLVVLVGLTQPFALLGSLGLQSRNDIETWMPETAPARVRYEEFKRTFGAEEFILVALDESPPDEKLIEALCRRLERLPEVRRCWSAERMCFTMRELGVSADESARRVTGLLRNTDGSLTGVAVLLSERGFHDRMLTVQKVRDLLSYCGVGGDRSIMTGPPVFVAELDRLGGREANIPYFMVTLTICLGLLYLLIREEKLTVLVFCVTVWAINVTVVLLGWIGSDMNMIVSSIPVLVMVFTMSISVHYLYYYQEAVAEGAKEPVLRAIELAWKPTFIATLATCVGEMSLSVSDIAPVREFAYGSTLGSIVAMVAGLGITPALVAICPTMPLRRTEDGSRHVRVAGWIVQHSRSLSAACLLLTVAACFGLPRLQADLNVVDFLPKDSKLRQDFLRIERDFTAVDSLEVMVNFADQDLPFVGQLEQVRRIDGLLHQHRAVAQTLSLASFFPDEMPQDPVTLASLLKRAERKRTDTEFLDETGQLWRISARVRTNLGLTRQQILDDLTRLLANEPVTVTGMSALVESTQREIFDGFGDSVLLALGLITLAIVLLLRSVTMGVLAMLPNVAPLCWVYGMMGWTGNGVDIATMLSGSIALGMSVDGTFHFISRFRHHQRESGSVDVAIRNAQLESSIPFIQATLTATAGMFGMLLSPFVPTIHFGVLMIALMLAALVGDVVMLPALLHVAHGGEKRKRLSIDKPGHDESPCLPLPSLTADHSLPVAVTKAERPAA